MPEKMECPNCGASLQIHNPGTAKMLYCEYCGSEIDINAGTGKKLTQLGAKPVPAKSALKLGLEGELNGLKYQVVGRVRYKDLKSYEPWDEWLLLSENGQYLWLQEEDWEFVLMHKYTPKIPFDPNSVRDILEVDGYRLEVEDKSSASIIFFEGEMTWKASAGETINYIDAWKGEHVLYSCEWTAKEINYFIGREITAEKLYEAFNLGKLPEEAEEDYFPANPFQKFTRKLIDGPAFKLCTIFAILLIFSGLALEALNFIAPELRSASVKSEKTAMALYQGPYELTKVNKPHLIETSINGLNNKSVYLEYAFVNNENKPVMEFDGEYWHESGVDGGEAWSEQRNREKNWFILEEKGSYTLVAQPDPGQAVPDVNVSIKQGVYDTGPVWTLAFLVGIYPLIALLLWLLAWSNVKEVDD